MTDLYQSQRAMRQMRRQALQRGVVAILDVGSSKIACLVLRFDGSAQPNEDSAIGSLAGQSGFRVIGAATTRSRGVQFGEISAMQETERAIRTAVQAAQKMAGVRVDHVIACFAGANPRSYGLDAKVELQAQEVSENEIARVLAACEVPDYGAGREVVHAQPVNFALDNRSGLSDPRGQMGQTLSVDMHMLTVDSATVQNLMRCIQRCDLELAGIASSAYASGYAALVEDEQELGAACIDMGGGSTSISVFMKKHMIYADAVRMGGDHITSDISMGLGVPMANAERIKTFCGGVHATGADDRDMIDIGGDTGDWEHDRRTVSRAELIGIMRPRVEEILEEVRVRLDAAGFEYLPSQQIVLTGGSSQIMGLDALASRILGQQVRLGRPLRVHGLPQSATGPGFASAVGLSLFAAHPQDEWWDFEMPVDRYPARSLRRAVKWFKDNW
ncbi:MULTISPECIES: cell division protein FtsA [Rhodobacterales]|jgi:cell division protein FtsA|uniref:Cell division protein FtsA n=1 Tax=Phaeobacter gallaeciensis TaxID=60890 RepID=A0A1B0ZW75_9RHOB|nr:MULTISPECIES: cell division protein FtsA [Phaeobacter]MDF1770666.1 cell division protein FtsA [Pseudophaeobacter sp. bin_em_oilr2.035]ANP38394.1 cell division protein FtsA [Phaeobacter gallaeciensis]MDE4060267.1 cell division protein FtsA [Phaeobacter gallaeciensis]MDE4095872.1 cell division protein FtsA [Phaeobacter gallaeciensis]MDE4104683.1 cell division protein FtsA [Phaeobacter gallaeciensis]